MSRHRALQIIRHATLAARWAESPLQLASAAAGVDFSRMHSSLGASSSTSSPDCRSRWTSKHQIRAFSDDVARRRLLASRERQLKQQERSSQAAAAAQPAPPPAEVATEHAPPPAPAPAPAAVALGPPQPATELQVAAVVNHPALIVTRAVEWGQVVFGFEVAQKYEVYDQDGTLVALMAEDSTGLRNELGRQLLRSRRSFTATVLTPDGAAVVFRVRRPAYLVSSVMFIEDGQGQALGEVRQRWHPWRRNYDLYVGRRQFAAIKGGLLAWEFELTDEAGRTLALVDRNFQGFAKELFTDAGKYVVHFGFSPEQAAQVASTTVAARSGQADAPTVTPLALARTDVAVIPSVTGNQLVVQQPLPLTERMLVLACAVAIDYNYFSRHSHTGGLITPPLFMPIPGGGASDVEAGPGGGASAGEAPGGGAAGAGAAAATSTAPDVAGVPGGGVDGAGAFVGGGGFQQAAPNDAGGLGGAAGGTPQASFGEDTESFRWDSGGDGGDSGSWSDALGGGGGDGGGGGGEEGGVRGLLRTLWEIFGDGGD